MNDLKFAIRQLRRNRSFTLVAVLTLALGIGANTAIFTVINSLLLRSLPVRNPDDLVQVVVTGLSGRPNYSFSFPFYEQLREQGRSLSGLFAAGGVGMKDRLLVPNGGNAEPEFVRGQPVSGNFFGVLGVPALLGRALSEADDQPGNPAAVAVISYRFWQGRFGGDPSVVGRAIAVDDVPFTIVGVTPPEFFGFQPGENPELWWPLQMAPQVDGDPRTGRLQAGSSWLRLVGRLSPGVRASHAEAELGVLFQRYQSEFAATRSAKWSGDQRQKYFSQRFKLVSARTGWAGIRDQLRQPLLILLGVVATVLLIACANVASLLLARAAAREREFCIRSALGAAQHRLVRQLLTESLLLATLGGGLGLVVAQGGTRLLQSFLQLQSDPISLSLQPDLRVLLFTIGCALLTGLLFGLAPAGHSSRYDLVSALAGAAGSGGGPSRQRSLQALVVVQVGLSLLLLVGAGLFLRTLQHLRDTDAGFQRENVILFNLDFADRPETARWTTTYQELLARLEALPGVRAASLFNSGLLSGSSWTDAIVGEGYQPSPGEDLECAGMAVGRHFFETFGMPLIAGREFGPVDEQLQSASDTASSATAVINQSLARRYFGKADPLGRRFHFAHRPEKKFVIVGVIPDAKYRNLRDPAPPTFYVPFFREDRGNWANFAVRTRGDPRTIMADLRGIVREVDARVRLRDVRTMDEVVIGSVYREQIIAQLGSGFGLFALALACTGLYGVLSFGVLQRTREIGVRLAVGAQRRDIYSLVIYRGLRLVGLGATLGLAAAWATTHFLAHLLYGVGPMDPASLGLAVAILFVVAAFASWLPARRAASVDPMDALRDQ